MQVTTLTERKANEAARRRRAADAVVEALAAFARAGEGTFTVFGSYVRKTMRFDSDLDILVEFPVERTAKAWNFVEETCAFHRIPADIHDARTMTAPFLERVRAEGLVVP
ncbi:nucleotidyltransferase family protein [Jiella avicenniae]|uniref:Nucleotidyltransferase domain-containing protein n=1 Tax=Jiella avicenniae TaxID=2907202 RepID=A0A9X1P3M3_9HYPH|nr:nucleotidyltransferase domain-containing protein [Jiella avicenniae]MCE7029149.1 nucleotidyltransferase domain-containing protein [Jiella avicenniae]